MNRNSLWPIVLAFLLLMANVAVGQTRTQKPAKKTEVKKPVKKSPAKQTTEKKTTPAPVKTDTPKPPAGTEGSGDDQKVREMVAFFQYVLNTLGSKETAARDKDVLIRESYSKIFRDDKVQVEDDLDEAREVITNKDVIAYLKDVDFFFTNVRFEFVIEDIRKSTLPSGELFYKVSLRRTLTGTTSEGTSVTNTQPRYVEINYNPDDQDLKIVSIYTNEFDESEALTNWWKELSLEWQSIFRRKLGLGDSLAVSDIKNVTSIEEIDLSNNKFIRDIEPLAELRELKLLDLSGTGVADLTPIRNLTGLVELNLSNTKVFDLTPLKYSSKLERLNLYNTDVRSVAVIENLTALRNLEMAKTDVFDFTPLATVNGLVHLNVSGTQLSELSAFSGMTELIELNIAATPTEDLSPVSGMKKLTVLNIDSTRVKDVSPLASLPQLKVLHANFTRVTDLQPLQKITSLEKIYGDQSGITRDKADAFMAANRKVLIVFNSKDLQAWWETLSQNWQQVLTSAAKVSASPTKEELAAVTNIDSINFSGRRMLSDLEPLGRLLKLQVIDASGSGIRDLSPLQQHREIRKLDISETEVSDLSVTSQFKKLVELRADRSKIQSIEALYNIAALQKFYADQTSVIDITARELLEKNPKCLVVHKTNHLNRWWSALSPEWKDVFRQQMGKDTTATRENLHRLVEQQVVRVSDAPVRDLSVLAEFVNVKELYFSGTGINRVPPLENLLTIRLLHVTNSPLQKIETLVPFIALEDLNISNTPVDDLGPLERLRNLRRLNASGTQIKKLDALERIGEFESLDCSNTNVSNLKPVSRLSLKTLKCYNTRISDREVKNFKAENPDCNVVYYR